MAPRAFKNLHVHRFRCDRCFLRFTHVARLRAHLRTDSATCGNTYSDIARADLLALVDAGERDHPFRFAQSYKNWDGVSDELLRTAVEDAMYREEQVAAAAPAAPAAPAEEEAPEEGQPEEPAAGLYAFGATFELPMSLLGFEEAVELLELGAHGLAVIARRAFFDPLAPQRHVLRFLPEVGACEVFSNAAGWIVAPQREDAILQMLSKVEDLLVNVVTPLKLAASPRAMAVLRGFLEAVALPLGWTSFGDDVARAAQHGAALPEHSKSAVVDIVFDVGVKEGSRSAFPGGMAANDGARPPLSSARFVLGMCAAGDAGMGALLEASVMRSGEQRLDVSHDKQGSAIMHQRQAHGGWLSVDAKVALRQAVAELRAPFGAAVRELLPQLDVVGRNRVAQFIARHGMPLGWERACVPELEAQVRAEAEVAEVRSPKWVRSRNAALLAGFKAICRKHRALCKIAGVPHPRARVAAG